ncbi:pyroglutamyl-peptidase I [Clostridium gasigenes]|uniref:pyroglutamyl-peptidase I n=1 Tax=Clostridium gasigenes TaxID=94869 RepID=UPI001C0B9B27|nr:pyroglutamyl-peptidase I [Clostridium gasigenes]MBU3087420.1 pyroglutamyl-peptidase I [Clostridium gasigenes]
MRALIIGFDPFGKENINPALEAVKLLPENIAGAEIIKLEIPTVFGKSLEKIEEAIIKHSPNIVISVGQAGGRFGVTPERVAINLDDARIKDNEGNQPIDVSIFEDGENAYFSSLPIKSMVFEMSEEGIPSSVSNTAGTFVCNHVMYGILYLTNKKYPGIKSGFIHVPYIPSQVIRKPNMPSMSLEDICKGLEISIKAAVENNEDIKNGNWTKNRKCSKIK